MSTTVEHIHLLLMLVMGVLSFLYLKDRLQFDAWLAAKTVACPHCAEEIRHLKSHEGEKLSAVTDPLFNLREACKNMLALEDHLHDARHRCIQCIKKHFMIVELFLDEALGLDRYGKYGHLLNGKGDKWRKIIADYASKETDDRQTEQAIRDMRKTIIDASFAHV